MCHNNTASSVIYSCHINGSADKAVNFFSEFHNRVVANNVYECSFQLTNSPAGTGTVTVRFCLVCPVPLHSVQRVVITPRPPHCRHVERMTNGPVFTVSYSKTEPMFQLVDQAKVLVFYYAVEYDNIAHHSCAIAVVAVLNL